MSINVVPEWMVNLDPEDVAFIRNFLLASGSLKQIAGQYGVTYPTVRLRLDKLIRDPGQRGCGERRLHRPYQAAGHQRQAGCGRRPPADRGYKKRKKEE